MKNLSLLLVLLIPFSIIAQNKVDVGKTAMNDETSVWMDKISSDPDLRGKMMDMMIDKTKDNKEEMTKLANTMMDNAEMHKIMLAMHPVKSETENISLEPRSMMNDSVKVMKMYKTTPMPKK